MEMLEGLDDRALAIDKKRLLAGYVEIVGGDQHLLDVHYGWSDKDQAGAIATAWLETTMLSGS